MKIKKQKHALVICNGEMPLSKHLASLLKSKPFILCADGGANKARSFGIEPDMIIGDLDSISKQTRLIFSHVPIIHLADQNSTDLEKALNYLVSNKFSSAIIIGATGERPDHMMANFSILLKYYAKITLEFFDDYCSIQIFKKRISFLAKLGQPISILPMGTCRGITTKGLKYPLKNETLELGVREGSSNEAVLKKIIITVKHGALLLFRIHSS
jgi:thiamine pyrophosphokinase